MRSARATRSPLSLLKTPGECGVDIAVGEGQPLGNRLDFGGPSFGFFAVTEALMRRLPGRIAGETRDVEGKRGFVLTLQTREQHIRREKATSNICTAQALNALAGVIYLSWLGRRGFVELGRAAAPAHRLCARRAGGDCPGSTLLHEQPVVREFAIALDAPVDAVVARCQAAGIHPGYPLGRDYPEHPHGLLVALTEQRSRGRHRPAGVGPGRGGAAERAGSCRSLRRAGRAAADDELTIYERSRAGRRAFVAPALGVPERPIDELLPAACAAPSRPRLPEVTEPEIVRHYNRLSKRNFDLDTGFYPLGSCTMKHNPKLHERVAALPGHAKLHPLQDPSRAQGALELMWRLQHALSEIAGLPHASLQPSAGLARRARRRAADARLPRGSRRAAAPRC